MSVANTNTVVSIFGVEPHRIGACETYIRELSGQLAARGWKHAVCFLSAPPDPVRRFLEGPGVSIHVIEDSDKLEWKPARRLAAFLSELRPRILHLYFTGFLSPYPWIARWHGAEQVFFTDQNSRPMGYIPRRYPWRRRALSRIVNRPIDKLICVSDYGLRCFTATDLLPAERFETIYNSVDISRADAGLGSGAEFRRRHGIPEDRVVVAQVSWMIPEKGIQDLLEAACLVAAEEPKAHFLLAGGGAQLEENKRLAAQRGIAGNVTFTGVVQDPLVQGLYAAADIACQVSRWEEVFGYVIAEAMASYKPVLGTRVGGIPEVVEDGKTGYVVNRGDIRAMAEKLLLLIRDRRLREAMGQAGRARAEALFNHTTNVASVVRLYGIG